MEERSQPANYFLKMEAPLPRRSRLVLRRNTMKVRCKGSRMTMRTVVTANQEPVIE